MKTQIDCYGFEATSEHFQKRTLEAYLVKDENAPAPKASGCLSEASPKGRKGPRGVVYACFGVGEQRRRLPERFKRRSATCSNSSRQWKEEQEREKSAPIAHCLTPNP